MSQNIYSWQILYVEDDQEIAEQLKTYFSEITVDDTFTFEVTTVQDFEVAMEHIEKRRYDILILDVINDQNGERDEDAGQRVFDQVKAHCFLPVVFYTGVPKAVDHLNSPMVRIVPKDDGVPKVLDMTVDFIQTGIPQVNHKLSEHVKLVTRDYMWDFVSEHWNKYGGVQNSDELAYLLTRRLSISLASEGVQQLSAKINEMLPLENIDEVSGSPVDEPLTGVSPLQYYVVPPIAEKTVYGDIYLTPTKTFVIVLTPTCDIYQNNDNYILLSPCVPLLEHDEYGAWARSEKGKNSREKFQRFLMNRGKENFYFLPAFLGYPDFVVNLQQLFTVSKEQFQGFTRIASLDSVFASELNSRFLRHYGRYGSPDLNVQQVYERLMTQFKELQR